MALRLLRRIFYILLLISVLLLIAFGLVWKKIIDTPLINEKSEVIYIPPGSSIYTVATMLYESHKIRHPKLLALIATLQGKSKKLKAGEYLLTPGITPNQLLTKLVEGKVFLRPLTIVEGWTLKQVLRSVNKNSHLLHTINTLTPPELSQRLGTDQVNLEGALFPDTYLFAAGVADIHILKKALWTMHNKLLPLWNTRAKGLPYQNPNEVLVVASLIEKETARPEERAKIAGVILRRLEKKMRLQIDASVIYGMGALYKGRLTREDLKIDTPYNTYLHAGLPPTPIAMPGLPSIYAALHPDKGNALYYVARGDGSHEFTSNLQAHINAIKKFHVRHLEPALANSMQEQTHPYIPWFNLPSLHELNLLSGHMVSATPVNLVK